MQHHRGGKLLWLNGFYSAKVAEDDDGRFFIEDLQATGVDFHKQQAASAVLSVQYHWQVPSNGDR